MNIREINRPVTAKSLNESLAKRFGQKIALDKFTTEQLQDVRNKIRTTMSQVETNESFDTVQSESYQKNKLFLDVLNAEIVERADVVEGELPPALKAHQEKKNKGKKPASEKAGKGKMPMDDNGTPDDKSDDKPAFLKKKTTNEGYKKTPWKLRGVPQPYLPLGRVGTCAPGYVLDKTSKQGLCVPEKELTRRQKQMKSEAIVREGAEDQAELVMAAKNMVDRVTSWMEDTAEMQTESMLELADAIRDEKGQEASDAYVNTVKPALESLYGAMEVTRQALTSGVGQMTGERPAETDMGTDMDAGMDADMDMEPTVDGEEDFAAADAAAGGDAEAGRERRESIARKKSVLETSRRLGTILSKKK